MVLAVAAVVLGVVAMHALAAGGHGSGSHHHVDGHGHSHEYRADALGGSPGSVVAAPAVAKPAGHETPAVAPANPERSIEALATIVASLGPVSLPAGARADADGLCLHGETHEDCPGHLHPMMTCQAVLTSAALVLLLLLGIVLLARRSNGTVGSLARTAERSPPGGWDAWRRRLPSWGPSLSELCISRT
jgi:hypothetical protein